jgi:GH24 family phage-related lysozyme (muramidase)
MYLDEGTPQNPGGLVTTGIGNLIDPVDLAVGLPWTHGIGGLPASDFEIRAAWATVKYSGRQGTGGGNQGDMTDLRLSNDAIAQLVLGKLAALESQVRPFFPGWDSLYADAQLGTLSMFYAMGAGELPKFPKFRAAVNAGNWNEAALQSWMRDSRDWVPSSLDEDPGQHPPNLNEGLRPRNLANRQLFLNAGMQAAAGADPAILVWGSGQVPSSAGILTGAAVASTAHHPLLFAFGATVAAVGAVTLAQQLGWIRRVSPKADRTLVRWGRAAMAPVAAVETDIDRWIRQARGGRRA